MIISRVFPSLIKLSQVVKLNTVTKTYVLNSAGVSGLKRCLDIQRVHQVKMMSTDVEKEMNDPGRHFDYEQLIEKKDKSGVVVIDVREHSEIKETGKIPGSVHIPLAELERALGEMKEEEFKNHYHSDKPQKDTEVIFSCKAGGRSLKALKLALTLGYNNARNYKGGWLDWAEKSSQEKQ